VRVRSPEAAALREALGRRGVTARLVAPDVLLADSADVDTVGRTALDAHVVLHELALEPAAGGAGDLERIFLELTRANERGVR
jgi:hypothetical protein